MSFLNYIKSLINGDTNDDVKDFGAMLFYWILGFICSLSSLALIWCKEWAYLLGLIGSIITFILSLLGIKTYKDVKSLK